MLLWRFAVDASRSAILPRVAALLFPIPIASSLVCTYTALLRGENINSDSNQPRVLCPSAASSAKPAWKQFHMHQLSYEISQRCRKRIEEVFGWIKGSAGLAKVKLRGRDRVDAAFTLALAAYNLIRLPKLLAVQL